jgi:hypothetical protein
MNREKAMLVNFVVVVLVGYFFGVIGAAVASTIVMAISK